MLAAGTRLGNFEIVGPLAAGGMGEVYRARNTTLRHEVALKVLPVTFLRDRDRTAHFKAEAEVLATLEHKDGVAGAEHSRTVVPALIEGPTLADRIQAGPLPLDEVLAISKKITEGMQSTR
ncbi:MAG TPA: hypothetical protein VMT15_18435 [Bryobacteraceae bacterium]|nr:hypothetical protein [Bryobacteraceae bacterium]